MMEKILQIKFSREIILISKDIKRYGRHTNKEACYSDIFDRFNRLRDLLKEPVLKESAKWTDDLSNVLKKYDNAMHISTELTPIQASNKSNGNQIYQNNRDKRKKRTSIQSI